MEYNGFAILSEEADRQAIRIQQIEDLRQKNFNRIIYDITIDDQEKQLLSTEIKEYEHLLSDIREGVPNV